MANKLPYWAFYDGDWWREPGVRACSCECRGAYVNLLLSFHRSPHGRGILCGSHEELRRLAGAEIEAWHRLLSEMKHWTLIDVRTETNGDVTLLQRRMCEEERERTESRNRAKAWRDKKKAESSRTPNEKRATNEQQTNGNVTTPSSSSSSISSSSSPKDTAFDLFWEAYPKKVKKPRALRAWKKIAPDKGKAEKIINAVNAWKLTDEWDKEAGRYIPHPSTWLNDEGWENELPKSKDQLLDEKIARSLGEIP